MRVYTYTHIYISLHVCICLMSDLSSLVLSGFVAVYSRKAGTRYIWLTIVPLEPSRVTMVSIHLLPLPSTVLRGSQKLSHLISPKLLRQVLLLCPLYREETVSGRLSILPVLM